MIDINKKHIPRGRTNIHKMYMLPSIKLITWPLVLHISKYLKTPLLDFFHFWRTDVLNLLKVSSVFVSLVSYK